MTSCHSNGENSSPKNNSTPNSSSSFSCKQALYHSIAKADLQLPKSWNDKAEVIKRLAAKYKLRKLKQNWEGVVKSSMKVKRFGW